ncbi:DUF6686 family protein [Flagellimonas meridianipacifica]|uniref:Uncharacterized protein n=1 Tax=Flagellimonas meridianipacifica TaxID=1080225 RepID=A0A2T0M9D8_9FLAO|nr:DUF6686 family protein [Allomuricauda pacifica]PRX54085.1 hypothetical protein CLV81_2481 [Allomuricauda pacifica]
MNTTLKFLNQTKNGCFTFCDSSKLFQITFNNLCFEFYEWELESFKSYISVLMQNKWDSPHADTFRSKKIPISVGNKYFVILVSEEELFELHVLLSFETKKIPILKVKDINYRFIEN